MRDIKTTSFWSLQEEMKERAATGDLEFPVFELPSAMPRTDGVEIFDEGRAFGGVEETAHAIACVTLAASAHAPSTVSRETFISTARGVFEQDVRVPSAIEQIDILSPQAIVWWALKKEGEISKDSDFMEISNMKPSVQSEFFEIIATQTHKSAQLVNALKGNSIIWGSWGNGSPQEIVATGQTRGVPTNKIGHSHVIHIDEARQQLNALPATPTDKEQVNFADPWTEMVYQQFGQQLVTLLKSEVQAQVASSPAHQMLLYDNKNGASGLVENYPGIEVVFEDVTDYGDALRMMTILAGGLESIYQNLTGYHKEFYLQTGRPQNQKILNDKLVETLQQKGFEDKKAQEFAKFIFGIKPTFIQLNRWIAEGHTNLEGLHARYQKVAERMKRLPGIMGEVVADTYRSIDEVEKIGRTLPVHASGWYLFEDYTVSEQAIVTNGFKFFPSLSSWSAAPERILGGVQRRALR